MCDVVEDEQIESSRKKKEISNGQKRIDLAGKMYQDEKK